MRCPEDILARCEPPQELTYPSHYAIQMLQLSICQSPTPLIPSLMNKTLTYLNSTTWGSNLIQPRVGTPVFSSWERLRGNSHPSHFTWQYKLEVITQWTQQKHIIGEQPETAKPATIHPPPVQHKYYEESRWQRAALAESNIKQESIWFIASNANQALVAIVQRPNSPQQWVPFYQKPPSHIPEGMWSNVFSMSTKHIQTDWANSSAPSSLALSQEGWGMWAFWKKRKTFEVNILLNF